MLIPVSSHDKHPPSSVSSWYWTWPWEINREMVSSFLRVPSLDRETRMQQGTMKSTGNERRLSEAWVSYDWVWWGRSTSVGSCWQDRAQVRCWGGWSGAPRRWMAVQVQHLQKPCLAQLSGGKALLPSSPGRTVLNNSRTQALNLYIPNTSQHPNLPIISDFMVLVKTAFPQSNVPRSGRRAEISCRLLWRGAIWPGWFRLSSPSRLVL